LGGWLYFDFEGFDEETPEATRFAKSGMWGLAILSSWSPKLYLTWKLMMQGAGFTKISLL
jgi:hypothetical protein